MTWQKRDPLSGPGTPDLPSNEWRVFVRKSMRRYAGGERLRTYATYFQAGCQVFRLAGPCRDLEHCRFQRKMLVKAMRRVLE